MSAAAENASLLDMPLRERLSQAVHWDTEAKVYRVTDDSGEWLRENGVLLGWSSFSEAYDRRPLNPKWST